MSFSCNKVLSPAYRQEATLGVVTDSSANCIEQTTEWSACSKSCGMGFSTRVTNRNQQCEMVKQTRLCMIRPCENEEPPDKVSCKEWQGSRASSAVIPRLQILLSRVLQMQVHVNTHFSICAASLVFLVSMTFAMFAQ